MVLRDQIVKFIDESVTEAFTTMMLGEPKRTDEIPNLGQPTDIICSIGFTGKIEGAFTICSSSKGACKVVSKMLDMDLTEVTPDVIDGIGEITNIVVGGVKTRLAALDYDFEISVPNLVRGQDLEMAVSEDKTEIKSGFFCEELEFGIIAIYKIIGEAEAKAEPAAQAGIQGEAGVGESTNDEVKAQDPGEEKASENNDFVKDAPVVSADQDVQEDRSIESKEKQPSFDEEKQNESPKTELSENMQSQKEPQEQTKDEAWSALDNLVKDAKNETETSEEEKPSTPALGSIVQKIEDSPQEEPQERISDDVASALEAVVQDPKNKSESPQEKEKKNGEKTGSSVDALIKAAGDKARREQEKKGAESAVSALNALVQNKKDVSDSEQPAGESQKQEQTGAGGILPKAKIAELIGYLEIIPSDMLTKNEIENILNSVLKSLSSEGTDAKVAVEVDEVLKKLDNLLEKIKRTTSIIKEED